MFKLLGKLFGSGRKLRPAPAPRKNSSTPAAAPPGKPGAVAEWEREARRGIDRDAPPEQLCGLTPDMSRDEIRDHLAMLYRRHNRAASSLDGTLREEAEIMLDAVVRCRESFLETPATKPQT